MATTTIQRLSLIHIWNTATFHVKASDHKGETGSYITHIYLTDKKGRRAPIYGLTATLPAPVKDSLPIIKTAVASNITSSGYDVTATFDAPAGVVSVLMPTWTENGGQDDLCLLYTSSSSDSNTSVEPSASAENEKSTVLDGEIDTELRRQYNGK